MANYEKMYAVLCGAVDDVIDDLERIPLAYASARKLRMALQTMEDLYIDTSAYSEETGDRRIIRMRFDRPAGDEGPKE